MGPADSRRIPRAPRYSGSHWASEWSRLPGFHRLWPDFPVRSASLPSCPCRGYYPGTAATVPVWALPRSLATTCGITVVFFSYGYLDVSVPRVRLPDGMTGLLPAGLPHSDIPGSRVICTSPGLFAAYHVLLRLREPRHPPSALAYFPFRHLRAGLISLSSLFFTCSFSFQHVKDLFCGE